MLPRVATHPTLMARCLWTCLKILHTCQWGTHDLGVVTLPHCAETVCLWEAVKARKALDYVEQSW